MFRDILYYLHVFVFGNPLSLQHGRYLGRIY